MNYRDIPTSYHRTREVNDFLYSLDLDKPRELRLSLGKEDPIVRYIEE